AAYLARLGRNCSFDLGYSDRKIDLLVQEVEPLFSAVLPVQVTVDLGSGIAALLDSLTAARELAIQHRTFATDIWSRYPALRSRPRSCRAVVQVVQDLNRYSPVPGAELLLVISASGTDCQLL